MKFFFIIICFISVCFSFAQELEIYQQNEGLELKNESEKKLATEYLNAIEELNVLLKKLNAEEKKKSDSIITAFKKGDVKTLSTLFEKNDTIKYYTLCYGNTCFSNEKPAVVMDTMYKVLSKYLPGYTIYGGSTTNLKNLEERWDKISAARVDFSVIDKYGQSANVFFILNNDFEIQWATINFN